VQVSCQQHCRAPSSSTVQLLSVLCCHSVLQCPEPAQNSTPAPLLPRCALHCNVLKEPVKCTHFDDCSRVAAHVHLDTMSHAVRPTLMLRPAVEKCSEVSLVPAAERQRGKCITVEMQCLLVATGRGITCAGAAEMCSKVSLRACIATTHQQGSSAGVLCIVC
jgi:hypothetical protein